MAAPYQAPAEAHAYVLDQVRRTDRDRFLGALFAPEPQRRDLLAVLAFDHELARTRTVTREPLLAEIRLQWWREAIEEAPGQGPLRAQPLVQALGEAIRARGLTVERLTALIDAHAGELDGTLDVRRVGVAFAELALAALGVSDPASRAAAAAIATAERFGEGIERAALLSEARSCRPAVAPAALPVLLPAVALGRRLSAWRKPLAFWWAARTGRY